MSNQNAVVVDVVPPLKAQRTSNNNNTTTNNTGKVEAAANALWDARVRPAALCWELAERHGLERVQAVVEAGLRHATKSLPGYVRIALEQGWEWSGTEVIQQARREQKRAEIAKLAAEERARREQRERDQAFAEQERLKWLASKHPTP